MITLSLFLQFLKPPVREQDKTNVRTRLNVADISAKTTNKQKHLKISHDVRTAQLQTTTNPLSDVRLMVAMATQYGSS